MFELIGVSKSCGGRLVLRTLDLAFAPEGITVLLGPAGSGKSLLLRLLIGLDSPDTGTVLFGGHLLTPANASYYRPRIGWFGPGGGLFPHWTARQNVTLMARFLHWAPGRIARRTAELAEQLGLPAAALDRYPSQLSPPQQRQTALLRALFLDPDALLLDEPLEGLEIRQREELQQAWCPLLGALRKTVVWATRNEREAAAPHVAVFRMGEETIGKQD